jgi:hypothetical protein
VQSYRRSLLLGEERGQAERGTGVSRPLTHHQTVVKLDVTLLHRIAAAHAGPARDVVHVCPVISRLTNSPGIALESGPPAALDNIQQAYNPNWSCPLTPFENRLKVAVRAGEKVFEGASHE